MIPADRLPIVPDETIVWLAVSELVVDSWQRLAACAPAEQSNEARAIVRRVRVKLHDYESREACATYALCEVIESALSGERR